MTSLSKVTDLNYAILGLLQQGPQSGYAIRMMFQSSALGNYSSSPGSIYPALKRLSELKLIEKKVHAETKNQEAFYITKKGTNALRSWILSPVTRFDILKGFDSLLLRIAFMDTVDIKQGKVEFLQSVADGLSGYLLELESYQQINSGAMPMSGKFAFEHGVDSLRFKLKWIERLVAAYQQNK